MRTFLMLLAILFTLMGGCVQTPAKDYDRWKRELEMEEKGETPLWSTIDHPVAMVYAGGGPGTFRYKTNGSGGPGRRDKANANLYRLAYLGATGAMIDWMRTSDSLEGGTTADDFDIWFFANRPMWPNRRLRFMSRPGGYFQKLNLKKAQAGDFEPWTLGFRFELEAEVDIVKARRFNLSAYGSGRIGGGWGQTKVNGKQDNTTSWGYGWEAGVRAQFHRWWAGVAWLDRTTQMGASSLYDEGEYGFAGGLISVGLRW